MNKRFLLAIFLLLTGYFTFAQYTVQSKYFVYLQTEPAQPFYIKINNQRIAANSSGYLILPQLKDGDYKLTVGFDDNKSPEMMFNFKIDSKDKGYLIKSFGAEGWSLFDLQTMAVQKPLSAEEMAAANKPVPKKQAPVQQAPPKETPAVAQTLPPETKQETVPADNVSDFTKVLSKAANDPSLLEQPKPEEKPVVKEEAPATPPAEEKVVDAPAENTAAPVLTQGAPEKKAAKTQKGGTSIVKLSQQETDNGTVIIYEDHSSGNKEQIEITIPITPAASKEQDAAVVEKEPEVQAAPETSEQQPVTKADQNFVVEEKPAIPQESTSGRKKRTKGVKEEKNSVAASSGNCKSVASEDDFLKLRREMAASDNDDKMIDAARRAFKNKCYSTAQLKYISSMFLSNAGKYNFFEVALSHVSDAENFSGLKSEIKDKYYQDKFSALVK